MKKTWLLILLIIPYLGFGQSLTQEPATTQKGLLDIPARFNEHIQNKTNKLEAQLTRASEKYLQKLARKEEKLARKLMKTDSLAAKELFANSKDQYAALAAQLKEPTAITGRAGGQYLPYVDSLKSSLSFLQQNSGGNPVAEILSSLASGIVGASGTAKGTFDALSNTGTSPLLGAMNAFRDGKNPEQTTKPKAYLNWILLDE